jgi:hypothetical protein
VWGIVDSCRDLAMLNYPLLGMGKGRVNVLASSPSPFEAEGACIHVEPYVAVYAPA